MISVRDTEISCGVKFIKGVHHHKPETVIKEILTKYHWTSHNKNYSWQVQFLFSDNNYTKSAGYGAANLEKYIKKHKLGKIEAAMSSFNSNSGNQIRTCIWNTNIKNLRKFIEKGSYA